MKSDTSYHHYYTYKNANKRSFMFSRSVACGNTLTRGVSQNVDQKRCLARLKSLYMGTESKCLPMIPNTQQSKSIAKIDPELGLYLIMPQSMKHEVVRPQTSEQIGGRGTFSTDRRSRMLSLKSIASSNIALIAGNELSAIARNSTLKEHELRTLYSARCQV